METYLTPKPKTLQNVIINVRNWFHSLPDKTQSGVLTLYWVTLVMLSCWAYIVHSFWMAPITALFIGSMLMFTDDTTAEDIVVLALDRNSAIKCAI